MTMVWVDRTLSVVYFLRLFGSTICTLERYPFSELDPNDHVCVFMMNFKSSMCFEFVNNILISERKKNEEKFESLKDLLLDEY